MRNRLVSQIISVIFFGIRLEREKQKQNEEQEQEE